MRGDIYRILSIKKMQYQEMTKHWNLTYVINKVKTSIYYKLNPDKPWLTKDANQYLIQKLNKEMIGLEFGSGRSTIFFAKKLQHLVSVENNEDWYNKVSSQFKKKNINNVDYRLIKTGLEKEHESAYYGAADEFVDGYFDFILIDGFARDLCSLKSISKLKEGGLFVIDNVNWFLPSDSISPNSISLNSKCGNANWEKVFGIIKDWEKKWTSNGVTDTAIFIKPLGREQNA